jgi:hypothetical protein
MESKKIPESGRKEFKFCKCQSYERPNCETESKNPELVSVVVDVVERGHKTNSVGELSQVGSKKQ